MNEPQNIKLILGPNAQPVIDTLIAVLGPEAELHLVGGAVRDAMLGVAPKDFDFATKLRPNQMMERFQNHGIRFIETGIRRGTITALIPCGEEVVPVELTTFRNPSKENEFTDSIFDDLPSRDFTINAMAINVHTWELIDPFNGRADLLFGGFEGSEMLFGQTRLRAVGDPWARFEEDPHRILRLFRFAFSKFENAATDIPTLIAAFGSADKLQRVSVERIRDEFVKILCGTKAGLALNQMRKNKVLGQFLPELVACFGVEQNKHHKHDVFFHILDVINHCPQDPIIRLAALFHDIAKPLTITEDHNGRHFIGHEQRGAEMSREIMFRLKFSNEEIDKVSKLVAEHMRSIEAGPKAIRRLIRAMGPQLDQWMALKKADRLGGHVLSDDFDERWNAFVEKVEHEKEIMAQHKVQNLAISGKELIELGLKPGPKIGQILKNLNELVLDEPEKNNREDLLSAAKGMML